MSTSVTIKEAQAHMLELVANLAGGEEVIITQGQKPVARLGTEKGSDGKGRRKRGQEPLMR